MTSFPAVSLPSARQGSHLPCRVMIAEGRKPLTATGRTTPRGRFSARERIFSRVFPCSREAARLRRKRGQAFGLTALRVKFEEAKSMPVAIRQLHPVFVGEVAGIDCRRPLSPEEVT